MTVEVLLKGGRIFDPAHGIDMIGDVGIEDDRIVQLGGDVDADQVTTTLDVSGQYVAPGFIDVHAHTFGPIGFASADSIGVSAGVTSLCDAGGVAVDTIDDFIAQVRDGAATDVYSWLFIGPGGLDTGTADGRLQTTVRNKMPFLRLADLLDVMDRYGDVIVGIKTPAFGELARPGPMKIAKGVSQLVDRPLYVHVGDLQLSPDEWAQATAPAFEELGTGDVLTHCYTPNPGGLLDQNERLQPAVADALDRGVLLDVGFGAFNFDFHVATTLLDQGVVPFTISSDLQQANVLGPVHSLAHVMSTFLALGLTLSDVVTRVTAHAATLLRRDGALGKLAVGGVADLTIFELDDEPTEFRDTVGGSQIAERGIVTRATIKNGVVHPVDAELAAARDNWSMNSVLSLGDDLPNAMTCLDGGGRRLLSAVAGALEVETNWSPTRVNEVVSRQVQASGLALERADTVILSAFLHRIFPQAPGYFLAGQRREFVLQRLRHVAQS